MSKTVVLFVADATGKDTLEYMLDHSNIEVSFPTLEQLGLGNILNSRFQDRIRPNLQAQLALALTQASTDPDSVIGHREMVGLITTEHYDLFPSGFPQTVIDEVSKRTGYQFCYNRMANGTEIISQLGDYHLKTKKLILYSSICYPVAQIAGHNAVIGAKELGDVADDFFQVARKYGVKITRAIARPFSGNNVSSYRRENGQRHDAVLPLSGKTLIELLIENGIWVAGVGKFPEMVDLPYERKWKLKEGDQIERTWFGVTPKDANLYSFEGAAQAILAARKTNRNACVLVTAVDTDAAYGHSLQIDKWLKSYEAVDRAIKELLNILNDGDILLFTADHGMQRRPRLDRPTKFYGYHNKELLPLLGVEKGGQIQFKGTKDSLTDIGQTISSAFGLEKQYLQEILH